MLLLSQLRQSKQLQPDLSYYDRLDVHHKDKSHEFLLSCMRKLLERKRLESNRAEIAKGLGQSLSELACSSQEGKGKGKTKEKGQTKQDATVPKGECFSYARTGKCEKGNDCPYSHSEGSTLSDEKNEVEVSHPRRGQGERQRARALIGHRPVSFI